MSAGLSVPPEAARGVRTCQEEEQEVASLLMLTAGGALADGALERVYHIVHPSLMGVIVPAPDLTLDGLTVPLRLLRIHAAIPPGWCLLQPWRHQQRGK